MRTTVILPDELYRQVKERARGAGQTVTSFMESALRQEIMRRDAAPARPVDVTLPEPFHGTGVRAGVDLTSGVGLLDLMDEDVALEKLR